MGLLKGWDNGQLDFRGEAKGRKGPQRNGKLTGGRRLGIRERETKIHVTSVIYFMILFSKGSV